MRRMSTWVTGVPLPGWMFCGGQDDVELAVVVETLPLRMEEAMTFTAVFLVIARRRAYQARGFAPDAR